MATTKKTTGKRVAQNSGFRPKKPKRKAPSTAFKPGNPWRIPKGQTLNPGGRPKLLSNAYREWLEHTDDKGTTNAAKVALAMGEQAAAGDIQAAKEFRQATEGDRLTFDLNQATNEQLERIANGEDPRVVLATPGPGGPAAPATNGTDISPAI